MKHQATRRSAALYARVSSDRQDVDLSVAAQLRALRDYAEKNDYVVARDYVDEAESGRVADRPQFRKMLDAAGGPDAPFEEILVWKFSRFTRKREHAVAFKSMLRHRGVKVTSITEHADDSPTGKLMEAIIESLDEFYSENLAQEVTRGMRESASRGFWVSTSAPYGYKKVPVQDGAKKRPRLELKPPADGVVRRMFHMAESGKSTLDIVKTLNGEGIATAAGKRWSKTTVHYVLTNEAYTGTLIWGKNARDGAQPVRVENAFPAITSHDQFECVADLMRSKAPVKTHPRRVAEEMDGVAREQRKKLEATEAELAEVRNRMDRLWHAVETSDLEINDILPCIRQHQERQERLEVAAEESEGQLSERRAMLDNVETITAFAGDMNTYLRESALTESRTFIPSFVKEVAVAPGKATSATPSLRRRRAPSAGGMRRS